MSDRPIPLRDVAPLLGRSTHWLYRHIRALRDQHGFPHPLPGVGLYDPLAIAAWKVNQRPTVSTTVTTEPDWGAILDARATQLLVDRRRA